jgi:hypothetical protein
MKHFSRFFLFVLVTAFTGPPAELIPGIDEYEIVK